MRLLFSLVLALNCLHFAEANEEMASENACQIIDTTEISVVEADEIPAEKIRFIKPYSFFESSKEFNMARTLATGGGIGVMYAGTSIWWTAAWYSQYDRGRFQIFNDNKEWLQMDKAAHIFNAYFLSRWGRNLFNWSGVQHKHSVWIGMLAANMWQLSIELNDGFVPKWGFSWGDILANLTGSAIYGSQQYLWKEQRFNVKISAFPVKYPEELRERTDALYGTTFSELVLKDYNAMTFWLNASPGSFIKNPNSKFPKWISISLGYGGTGMYGGFSNEWCANKDLEYGDCPEVDRRSTDIPRLRQYYLSMDIDFSKIPTRSPALKTFLEIINIVKVPFPALELRSDGSIRWNWLAF
jgi:uncharacterized protein YfiM (DUF2279 family)